MIDWTINKIVKPIILFLKGVRENAIRTWNLWIKKGKTPQKNELKANQKEKKKSKKKKEKVKRAF